MDLISSKGSNSFTCEPTVDRPAKKKIMKAHGIHVVDSPAEIGKKVKEVLG